MKSLHENCLCKKRKTRHKIPQLLHNRRETKRYNTLKYLNLFFQANAIFHLSPSELNHLWHHICFDWMPSSENIPKAVGVHLSPSYLIGIEVTHFTDEAIRLLDNSCAWCRSYVKNKVILCTTVIYIKYISK